MTDTPRDKLVSDIAKKLTEDSVDEGRVVALGFSAYLAVVYKQLPLPPDQHQQIRDAFFAGAQHVFASMITMLDSDTGEPSERDLRRMTLIHTELGEFVAELKKRF